MIKMKSDTIIIWSAIRFTTALTISASYLSMTHTSDERVCVRRHRRHHRSHLPNNMFAIRKLVAIQQCPQHFVSYDTRAAHERSCQQYT